MWIFTPPFRLFSNTTYEARRMLRWQCRSPICFSQFFLKRAALSLSLCIPVNTSSPQRIHANLLCHNPRYECRTTHPALKVPDWDLNLTDPRPHPSNHLQNKNEFCACVCVCWYACMNACAQQQEGEGKRGRRRRRTETS